MPDNIESESDIPSSLPYGLFNVIGEFTVDGEAVSTSGAMKLGTELKNELGYYSPRFGWGVTSNPIIAADYQAVAMDLQGVSANQLDKVKDRLDSAKTLLEASVADPDATDLTTLTRHSLTGDILQTGAMGYMAMTNVQSKLLALQSDIIYYREPSYGTFSTSASLSYFFLQPQTVKFGAVVMDMDRMQNSAECKSNCWNNWSEFNQQSGAMMSALEHVIPEQLFSTAENPAEAISAVKAISIANAQGQKIYTLTSDNFSSVNCKRRTNHSLLINA